MKELGYSIHTVATGSEGRQEDIDVGTKESDWPGQQDEHKEPDDGEQPASGSHCLRRQHNNLTSERQDAIN